MNINLPSFVRRPTEWKGIEHKLVLTYPFLVDSNIEQKYVEDLRDFFSVIFINNIKLSNFLSITTTIVSDNNQKAREISSLIQKVLSGVKGIDVRPEVFTSDNTMDRYEAIAKGMEYQKYINDRLNYISRLIQSDPYISKLNPFITMITINKRDVMINVPVIIGTKVFNCEYKTNFWILLAALLFNRRLTSRENLEIVKSAIDRMSPVDFYRYITNEKMRQELLSKIKAKPVSELPSERHEVESVTILGITFTLYDDNRLFISKISLSSPYAAIAKAFINAVYRSESFDKAKNVIKDFISKYKDKAKFILNNLKQVRDILIPSTREPRLYISIKRMEEISSIILDATNKTLNFWKRAMDRDEWDKFTGVHTITPSEVFSTSVARIHPKCLDKMTRSRKMFASYISVLVNPLLISISNILELHNEPYSLDQLLKNIIDRVVESYDEFSNEVWGIVLDSINNIGNTESPDEIDARIDSFRSALLSLGDYLSLLENVTTISENLRVGAMAILKGDDGFNKTLNLVNKVIEISRKFETFANSIIKHTKDILIKGVDESDFIKAVEKFRTDSIGTISIIDKISTSPADHPVLYDVFKSAMFGGKDDPTVQKKFSSFIAELARLMSTSFDRIVYFLGVISVATFLADVFELVKYEVGIVSRQATDFPNYCVVLPFGLLDSFYQIKLANVTAEAVVTGSADSISFKGKIGEKDPSKIVDSIAESLGIPNIIVVNKSADEFYYRFMFMNTTRKFKLSTIKSFIQSQKEIISL